MMAYPIKLTRDTNNTYLLTCPDIPEFTAVATDDENVYTNALETLKMCIDLYIQEKRPLPAPSTAKQHEILIKLPASITATVLLANAIFEQHAKETVLAEFLGTHFSKTDDLLNIYQPMDIDTIELALNALGQELTLTVAHPTINKDQESGYIPNEVIDLLHNNKNWTLMHAWRKHLHISKKEMAEKLHMSAEEYQKVELQKKLTMPLRHHIASIFGIHSDQLSK